MERGRLRAWAAPQHPAMHAGRCIDQTTGTPCAAAAIWPDPFPFPARPEPAARPSCKEHTMTIHTHTPFRGIARVNANADPVALVGQIKAAFEDHRGRNDARFGELQNQIADVASRITGLSLSGTGPAEPMNADRRSLNAALKSFIRDGADGPLAELVKPLAGMSVGSDPDGGYSVYPTLGTEMNRRIFEISPMRQIARVVPVASSEFEEFNDLDEAEAAWVGETQARPVTGTPTLGKLSVPVHELYAAPKVTQKLLDDSQLDIAAWLVEKCAQRFARKEGAAFVTGDGIQKPRGLLTYPTAATPDATRAWGTFEHVNTGTAGGWGAAPAGSDKLIDLAYALKVEYRPNARWLMNRKTAGEVRKLKDGDGNYLWQPSAMAGEPDRLMGFPVTLCEEMPDTTVTNALAIAFGDFTAGYVIADRHGLRLLRDPFTDKPNVTFYCYRRSGGAAANFEAVKFLRFGS